MEHLVKSMDLAGTIPLETESSTVERLDCNDFYFDIILPQKMKADLAYIYSHHYLGVF